MSGKSKAQPISAREAADGPRVEPKALKGKLGLVLDLVSRPNGATIDELVKATSWQRHSIRAAISDGLKKKHGLAVTFERDEAGRRYRLAEQAAETNA